MYFVGTKSSVLESRPNDFDENGLSGWTFTILAFWGESSKGEFVISIFDKVNTFTKNTHIKEIGNTEYTIMKLVSLLNRT